ncbi:hypothetical protein NXC14_CH00241 [Rhizobium sp. NXC14]|nr:hypothetical protein NXC14_CH00241 [Rhizobium sp. NXC14]
MRPIAFLEDMQFGRLGAEPRKISSLAEIIHEALLLSGNERAFRSPACFLHYY